jgi:hypothetical protein
LVAGHHGAARFVIQIYVGASHTPRIHLG